MANCCKQDMAANQRRSESEGHRFKTWSQQGLFTAESPLTSALLLVICLQNISVYVRCTSGLYMCFTPERWIMSTKKIYQGGGNLLENVFFSRVCPEHLLISSESILGDFLVCNAPDTPR